MEDICFDVATTYLIDRYEYLRKIMRRRSAAALATRPSKPHHDVQQQRLRRAQQQQDALRTQKSNSNSKNSVGITAGATTITAAAWLLVLLSLQLGTVQSQFADNDVDSCIVSTMVDGRIPSSWMSGFCFWAAHGMYAAGSLGSILHLCKDVQGHITA